MSEQSASIKQKHIYRSYWEELRVLTVSPEGNRLALGGVRPDGLPPQITLLGAESGDLYTAIESLSASTRALLFLSETQLLGGLEDGTLTLWDISKKKTKVLGTFEGDAAITALAVSADGEQVFAGDQNGTLRAFSLGKKGELKVQEFAAEWPVGTTIHALVSDPKGQWLAAAGDDGIIRVYEADGSLRRSMPGHEGAIYDMLLHPADARLISTGEDTSIRMWYLQGEVEFENRAESGSHEKAITSMAVGPLHKDESGEIIPPRLFTASLDGNVKIWPLGTKRKPKTLELSRSPLHGVVAIGAEDGSYVLAASEDRTITGWKCNTKTEPEASHLLIESTYQQLLKQLGHKEKDKRSEALDSFVDHMNDPQVYAVIVQSLQNDAAQEVRARAAAHLAKAIQRRPISELRGALNDQHTKVRKAALDALRTLQGKESASPFVYALQSHHADTRQLAIKELLPLHETIPQAKRLLHDAIVDTSLEVQITALDALETMYPSTADAPNPKPLLMVLESDEEQLKKEALRRVFRYKWTHLPAIRLALSRLLEDHEEGLRQLSFEVLIAGNNDLSKALRERNAELDRALKELEDSGKKKKKEDEAADKPATKKTPKKIKLPEGPPPQFSDEVLAPLFMAQVSGHDDLALRASTLLASLQDLRAFGTLLQFSEESTSLYRQETARALEQLQDPRVIPCLKQLLSDDTQGVRDTAFESLQALLDDPLALASAALTSPHADTRSRGLQKLTPAKKEKPSEGALVLLEQTLSDRDENVRGEAFKILWNAFIKEAPEKCLLPALFAHPIAMRKKAMEEIVEGHGKEEWAQEGLKKSLLDTDASTRDAAYAAMIKLADKGDASPHEAALHSPYPDLRSQALHKIGSYKAAVVKPLLLHAVQDQDESLRMDALERLLKRFSKDADALATTLDTPFWDVKLEVALHLAALGDKRALEVADDYLKDEQARLDKLAPPKPPQTGPNFDALSDTEREAIKTSRGRIIELVRVLGEPEGIPYIKPFLEDPSGEIKENTAYAISRSAGPDDEALLRELQANENTSIKEFATEGLLRLGLQGQNDLAIINEISTSQFNSSGVQRRLAAYQTLGEGHNAHIFNVLEKGGVTSYDAFVLILADEVVKARAGEAPTHLTSLLSLQHEDIKMTSAELLALRKDREAFEQKIMDFLAIPWANTSTKKEEDAKARAEKDLEGWLAALTAEEPTTRFGAASLLGVRRDAEVFHTEYKRLLRLLPKKPKLNDHSKSDHEVSAKEYATLAFGAYVSVLRNNSSRDQKRPLRRIAGLLSEEQITPALALPPLRNALDNSSSSELRKLSFQLLRGHFGEDDPSAYRMALAATPETEDVALQSLSLLSQVEQDWTKELVIDALQSKLRDVRYKAAELLQSYYDEDSLEPFILVLGSEHADVRLRVIDRLLHSSDDRVVDALQQALGSDHDDLRLKAAVALAERKEESTFSVLVDFLQREEYHLQTTAIQSLTTLHAPGTVDALIQRIEDDPDGSAEVHRIISALGQLRDETAAPWLLSQMGDGADYNRAQACYSALKELAGPYDKRDKEKLFALLEQALTSKQYYIRNAVISDLEELEHEGVQALLASAFFDRDEGVRRNAVNTAITRIPEKDKEYELLLPLLNHKDAEIKFEAARELANHGRQEAFLVLFTAFQTSMDGDVQSRAVDGLGRLGDQRALDPLMALWAEDAEWHPAQAAAAEALGRLAQDDRRQEIKSLLSTLLGHSNSDVQVSALIGTRFVEPDSAIDSIAQAIRNNSGWSGWHLRQVAAKQLGEMNDEAAESLLIKLMDDDDSDVKRAAVDSLYKIFGKDVAKVHLLVFDHPSMEYESERREEAAKFLAEHATPVEILERLPLLVSAGSYPDPFLDQGNQDDHNDSSSGGALARTLQHGLLSREPLPLDGFYDGLTHERIEVRINVAYMLAQVGDKKSGKALSQALSKLEQEWAESQSEKRDRLSQFWHIALWSLGVLAADEAAKVAQSILKAASAPAEVQALAAQILGQAGAKGKDAIAALQKGLQHPQEKVRRLASWSLAQAGQSGGEWLQELPSFPSAAHYLLPQSDTSSALPKEKLLTHEAKRELLPALIAQKQSDVFIALSQPKESQENQLFAIRALARIADSTALETLDAIRKDEDHKKDVRLAAYRAWRRAQRAQQRMQQNAPSA